MTLNLRTTQRHNLYYNTNIPELYMNRYKEKLEKAKGELSEKWSLGLDVFCPSTRITTKIENTDNDVGKFNKAKALFKESLSELLRGHKGEYAVAIEGQIIIGSDKKVLIKKAIDEIGFVPMYVGKISKEQESIEFEVRPEIIYE